MHILFPDHIIKLLLESKHTNNSPIYWALLERLMPRQRLLLKGPIVDANNRLNGIFPSFNLFSNEFSPGDRLIDIFTSCISFHSTNRKNEESRKVYIWKLNEIIFEASLDSKIAVAVLDTSIKNQVTIFIVYIHTYNRPVVKTIHHAINVTSMEAELFAIKCSINQATHISNIN